MDKREINDILSATAAFFTYVGHAVIVMSEHEDQICADSAKSFATTKELVPDLLVRIAAVCRGGKQDTAQAVTASHLRSPIASRRRNLQAGLMPVFAACLRSRYGRGVRLSRDHRWGLRCRHGRELGTRAHSCCGGAPSCGPEWGSAPTARVTGR